MTIYRKIYEQTYGPIPKEPNGRTYEIHHLDGNHNNNDPTNLKAVTIQEHYDIHYSQGDWAACLLISKRLNISPDETSAISRQNALKQLENGTHPFLIPGVGTRSVVNGTHNFFGGEVQRKSNQRRVENGTHHLLRENSPYIQNKTHHFFGGNVQRNNNLTRLANGTHPSQVTWTCEHCGKIGRGKANYTRYHGNACKNK
jgi:hypothetical protein